MSISIRTRRDVVDPDRFLAPARSAHHDMNPGLADAEVAEAVADVTDAVYALLEHGDLTAGAPPQPPSHRSPGVRVLDRPDGLSPAGWMSEVVVDEQPLQDYGCFLPEDLFARQPDPGTVERG